MVGTGVPNYAQHATTVVVQADGKIRRDTLTHAYGDELRIIIIVIATISRMGA